MRSRLLALAFLVSPIVRAEIYDGTYVQQPRNVSSPNPELIEREQARYEKNKITIKVSDGELTISMFEGADWGKMMFVEHGDTLVASDEDMYWVMFQKDKDTLVSTGMTFKRVIDASP